MITSIIIINATLSIRIKLGCYYKKNKLKNKKCDTQHNDTQHNNKKCDTQHNGTQHNNKKCNTQYNNKKCDTQHNDAQRNNSNVTFGIRTLGITIPGRTKMQYSA
jgi:hypothetical protein